MGYFAEMKQLFEASSHAIQSIIFAHKSLKYMLSGISLRLVKRTIFMTYVYINELVRQKRACIGNVGLGTGTGYHLLPFTSIYICKSHVYPRSYKVK